MNSNEISSRTNPRLQRIQKISAGFKYFFLVSAFLFVLLGVLEIILNLQVSALAHSNPARFQAALFMGVSTICWTLETWFAYRLFSFYARGDLFTADIVHALRQIGYISILIGCWNAFKMYYLFGFPSDSHPAVFDIVSRLSVILVQLVFSVVPSFVTIFIAWIMDEGRKIREEQELTV